MSHETVTVISIGAEAGESLPDGRGTDDRIYKEAAEAEVEIWHTGVAHFSLREAHYHGTGDSAKVDLTKHDALAIIHALQACVDSGALR